MCWRVPACVSVHVKHPQQERRYEMSEERVGVHVKRMWWCITYMDDDVLPARVPGVRMIRDDDASDKNGEPSELIVEKYTDRAIIANVHAN